MGLDFVRSLRFRHRASMCLLVAVLVLTLPAAAVAQSDGSTGVINQRATFTVGNFPDGPFHAHQSMLLFTPGAEAPLHRHGGPGYITVLSGEMTLYENGVPSVYHPNDSLVETPDNLYKGGNYTDRGMTLMVTYLIPHGEEVTIEVDDPDAPEPPEVGPEPLAETVWDFESLPASFELVHTISTFEPEGTTGAAVADGDILLTVVNGTLTLSMNGDQRDVGAGEAVLIEAGQEYVMDNATDSDAMAMSTELAPYAAEVLPQAGRPHHEPMVFWWIVMAASATLVIGGVLRIGVQRGHVMR